MKIIYTDDEGCKSIVIDEAELKSTLDTITDSGYVLVIYSSPINGVVYECTQTILSQYLK